MQKKINKTKKGQIGAGAVLALVLAVVVIVIAIQIATSTTEGIELQTVSESLAYTTAPTSQTLQLTELGRDNLVRNATITANTTFVNSTTAGGAIVFTNATNQSVTFTYDYEPIGYTSGLTSTLLAFVPIFIALIALFLAGALISKP